MPGLIAGPTRIPKMIGGYELLAKLGQGAMGAVFQARQVSMNRTVALKLLPPALARSLDFIERFQREARASVLITHPNLVQGIDVGQDEATGLWYFAMEFVPGEPLGDLLKREGRIEEMRALAIIRDVAAGLAAAHRAGLIHRDIKPDNVMLTPSGQAKILDLGLAKYEQEETGLTQTGVTIGTTLYMPPEQARGEVATLNASSDLYSLGATLFHLIAGQPPFDGSSQAMILVHHLSTPAPRLDEIAPWTSPATAALVAELLEKEQADRPATADAVVARIEDILAGRVSAPAAFRHTTSIHRKATQTRARRTDQYRRTDYYRKARRRQSSWPVGGTVAIVILIVVGVVGWANSTKAPKPSHPTQVPVEPIREPSSPRHPVAIATGEPSPVSTRTPPVPVDLPPQPQPEPVAAKSPGAPIDLPTPVAQGMQLVIWNQHNSSFNDRGTQVMDLTFYSRQTVVAHVPDQSLPWQPHKDLSATFPVPREPFDRIRVTVKRWFGAGGGLSEIQLLNSKGVNVLRGATARASAVFQNESPFAADKVTDGITTSEKSFVGFWLLPDQTQGWVEVDVPPVAK